MLARDQALKDPPPVRPPLCRSDVEQAARRAGARAPHHERSRKLAAQRQR